MARTREHLGKAPAREALINIRFEPELPLAAIRTFIDAARPSFEREVERREARFGFETERATAAHRLAGWRLDSEESHHVLMCEAGSFTFSRLSPYGRWETLREEARKWWSLFCELAAPQRATRIAVRYINAIDLPLPIQDFADFLTCAPRVPPEMPQGLSSFLQRLAIPDVANDCTLVVTQALEAPPSVGDGPPLITVLLDIDVFRTLRVPLGADSAIWGGLDELRVVKNRAFFSHLTERTVEMLE